MSDEEMNKRMNYIQHETYRMLMDSAVYGVCAMKDGQRIDPLEIPEYVIEQVKKMEIEEIELFDILRNNGYWNLRVMEGRGVVGLSKKLFTTGIVYGLDEHGYQGRYCYENAGEAALALAVWNGVGDPPGNWIVNKGERGGDRQNPNRVRHE